MVEKVQEKKSEGFKAFSNMEMPSLWDANKIKDGHAKNLATLKEAHGIVSDTLKKVSDVHVKHMKKQHSEAKIKAEGISEKIKSEYSVKEHVARIKAHHAEVSEKLKSSHEHTLNKFKETVDTLKEHHAKLHAKLHESKREHAEKLKAKMKLVQDHHEAVSGAWKDSTQKIMDLMKKTADHHLSNN